MVQIDIVYEGGLRTRATHGPSGQTLITDAPVDNNGKGQAFSPTDLVATGMGTCMLTIMGMVAERHGWPFVGARATVLKKMVPDPARRIGTLEVVVVVPGDWTEEQRATLEAAALGCPVHATLHGNVELPVRFDWEA